MAKYYCFAFAFINKCLIAFIHTQVTSDKALYLLISKTIIQGKAPLENTGLIDGTPNFFFNGAVTSPLYSILAVPFLWITKSPTTTSIILDCISWLVFLTGLYVLGNLLLKERWLVNILILILGFFIYPHELNPGPKDTLATGLFCWSCILANSIYSNPRILRKWVYLYIILLSLGLLKYLYMPVSIFFPIMILLITFSRKKSCLWKPMIVLMLTLSMSFYAFHEYLDYLKTLSHATQLVIVHDENNTKGFYPKNLLSIFPFLVSSVVDTLFWSVQLSKRFALTFQQIITFWKVIEVLIALAILIFYYPRLLSNRLSIAHKISLGVAVSVLLITILASTIIRAESSTWTFVGDPRFYLFPILLVQLFFWSLVFRQKTATWIRLSILTLFFVGFLHGVYFTTKKVITYKHVQQNLITEDIHLEAFQKIINPIIIKYNNLKFASNNKDLRRLGQINGQNVLFFRYDSAFVFNQNNYPLIVAVEHKDSALLHSFKPKTLFRRQSTNSYLIVTFK